MRRAWPLPLLLISCGGQITGPSDAGGVDASGADSATDAPAVTEGGQPTSDCVAHGGEVCTIARWVLCPAGYEPVSQTDGFGCGMGGWCCKQAPPSPCSQAGTGNCVDSCGSISGNGCWIIPVAAGCESGKVCCADGCD